MDSNGRISDRPLDGRFSRMIAREKLFHIIKKILERHALKVKTEAVFDLKKELDSKD